MTKKNLISRPIKFSLALLVGAVFILSTFIQESLLKRLKMRCQGEFITLTRIVIMNFLRLKNFHRLIRLIPMEVFFLAERLLM